MVDHLIPEKKVRISNMTMLDRFSDTEISFEAELSDT
jgi:hypothetical protein